MIKFYYHLAYWDRLHVVFSVHLYALKLNIVVKVQQKKKMIAL